MPNNAFKKAGQFVTLEARFKWYNHSIDEKMMPLISSY